MGLSFFPYAHYDLNAENLLRQPYGTGAETMFNFAINLQMLKTLRTLSTISNEQVDRVVYTLNIGESNLYVFH